jgi:hypothetical protein
MDMDYKRAWLLIVTMMASKTPEEPLWRLQALVAPSRNRPR